MFDGIEAYTDAMIAFMKSVEDEEHALDRVLATVLFTDIVGSTDKACELGDRRWTELLERHHQTWSARCSRAIAAPRSTPPETASWRPSTARRGR